VLPHIDVKEIIPYIDWKFFFHSWKISAKFASLSTIHDCEHCRAQWYASFRDEERAKAREAAKLYDDAREFLGKLAKSNAGYIRAVYGIYEAYSENDTVFIDGKAFPMLRQQKRTDKNEYVCLSDFIAPASSGKTDYIGAFAVTGGAGADPLLKMYEDEGDEYASLLVKSLLDRLAEAATEWLHARMRREYWGYAADENLTIAEMLSVKYQGIRPAVGYPSIPINRPISCCMTSSTQRRSAFRSPKTA
jgi:5-methyltetrahydrofolate--homocysteine methyltransferase